MMGVVDVAGFTTTKIEKEKQRETKRNKEKQKKTRSSAASLFNHYSNEC